MSGKAVVGYLITIGLVVIGLCFVCNTLLKDNPCNVNRHAKMTHL